MYRVVKFLENVVKFFRIKIKVLYWKIKYGKHIKIGKNVTFRKGFVINMTPGAYLEIGNDTGFNNYCSINCHNNIKIGNDNIFGENVKIYDHNHVFNNKNIDFKRNFKSNQITIGNRNWFGSNITILSKCAIGNNNVIGANVIINAKYDSDNIITNKQNIEIKKIKYE